jgi:hypothetical protein
VEVLTADIEHEEMHSGVRNVADPTYPVLARSLRSRRDNIRATIATLEAVIHGKPKAGGLSIIPNAFAAFALE